jgi:hypothetical protein
MYHSVKQRIIEQQLRQMYIYTASCFVLREDQIFPLWLNLGIIIWDSSVSLAINF